MAPQILTPYDVTGASTVSTAATRRASAQTPSRSSRRRVGARPLRGRELPWVLVSALTGLGAAAAASAWMVESIHLF
jgi:hypothetical protein